MLTSSFFIHLRSFTRSIGLNRVVGKLLLAGKQYEDRFSGAFRAQIRPGDTVWDVGANLGLYTREFLTATGQNGKVVAFEPVPSCFAKLREQFSATPQVRLMNMALGAADGTVRMAFADDPLAATHRVVGSGGDDGQEVRIRAGTSVVAEEPGLFPNVLKCDVEGHEGAVIDGLAGMLGDRRLRCIGIEMHFGLLAQRGEAERPRQIEQALRSNGFTVNWTDASHILAVR